jgi:hypothetical protein
MNSTKLHHEEWRIYGDAVFSLLTFPIVVGLLYWLIRLACTAAFQAPAGH